MTAQLATRTLSAGPTAIEAAARLLAEGGLVAFPTETVYGLGADATNGAAVARLYSAKGRPAFNPLIAHVAELSAARQLARFDADAENLAAAFWPGPLTLVMPKTDLCPVCDLAMAGLDTIAVRIPRHQVARDLITALGRPIVAPSANLSGHVSPTDVAHVMADLGGRIDLIIDDGPATVGVESTILACFGEEPTLLRPGGLSREAIEQVLGHRLNDMPTKTSASPHQDHDTPIVAPGMLASHYAPQTRLRLDATTLNKDEALLAFGSTLPNGAEDAVSALNLSVTGDLIEAAANLFSHLRALDKSGATMIAVMPVPHHGLGEAINDRLTRAAAPKPMGAAQPRSS